MTNHNLVQVHGQSHKQNGGENKRKKDDSQRNPGGDADQQTRTGAEQRPASGYPEQNPRRAQHQDGGGIDKNEVGNDLEGDWEDDDEDKAGGYQKG